jgi:hypothetical protein
MDRIKQRWHDLRYARVDLWRQLGGDDGSKKPHLSSPPDQTKPLQEHPDYLLTRRSLAQLQAQIGAIVAPAPDYYRSAVANHMAAQKRRFQSRSEAWQQERRLEKEYSGQLLQTEQIAFLLAALLESPKCFDESSSGGPQDNTASNQHEGITEGGGWHGRE